MPTLEDEMDVIANDLRMELRGRIDKGGMGTLGGIVVSVVGGAARWCETRWESGADADADAADTFPAALI